METNVKMGIIINIVYKITIIIISNILRSMTMINELLNLEICMLMIKIYQYN